MTNRTIEILGLAYGNEPANISATVNGTTIFTGTVPTQNAPRPPLPNLELVPTQVVFFSFERDTNLDNNITMTYTVNNGTVVFGGVMSNFNNIVNPAYTAEQLAQLENPATTRAEKNALYVSVANPALTPADLDTLDDPETPQSVKDQIVYEHNCGIVINSGALIVPSSNGDPRSNVYIDGQLVTPVRDYPGTWWWTVEAGSTLSCNFVIPTGLALT